MIKTVDTHDPRLGTNAARDANWNEFPNHPAMQMPKRRGPELKPERTQVTSDVVDNFVVAMTKPTRGQFRD